MWFKHKKLWQFENYSSFWNWFYSKFLIVGWVIKILLIGVFFAAVIMYTPKVVEQWKIFLNDVTTTIFDSVSWNIWQEMERDEFWQVNALLIGHDQWYRTDSIMIASFDPDNDSVSFMSIPRDLYIEEEETNYNWKLNWLLPTTYMHSDDLQLSINVLVSKISEMTGVWINYYAMIDFQWFVSLIDTLWWIEVDVPYDLVDPEFPAPWYEWYQPFSIEEWEQILDGETALKYARSRQTTSDFSRSHRQQLIVKAVIDKVTSSENLFNVQKIQQLYSEFDDMIETNISIRQMIWMMPYVEEIDNFHTFNLTADCDKSDFSKAEPWCFLYYPSREAFGWQSVLLQEWWTPSDPNNYREIQDFAYNIIYNQGYLREEANISVYNWIDRNTIYQAYGRVYPIANELATNLVKNWFEIDNIGNYEETYEETYEENVVYVKNVERYQETISMLRMFFDISRLEEKQDLEDDIDIKVVLWKDFIN